MARRPVPPVRPSDVEAVAAHSDLHDRLHADAQPAGRHPDLLVDRLPIVDGDLAIIAAPLDSYGVDHCDRPDPTRPRTPSEGNPPPFEPTEVVGVPEDRLRRTGRAVRAAGG